MKPRITRKPPHAPLALTPRDEEILRAVSHYRFATALDITMLHFSEKSIEHVRSILAKLAGRADLQPNRYLVRFALPSASGNRERIFTLGAKGRDYLARQLGLPVAWSFRPSKLRHLGYSHLLHSLLVTRVCVSAQRFARSAGYTLIDLHLSHELPKATVIPDAWLLLENKKGDSYSLLLEIDRGMEYQTRFKRHVRARLDFIASGEYAKTFGQQAVLVVYATTGQTPTYRQTRATTMCAWIMEVLEELSAKHWAGIFRVTSLTYEDLYTTPLFAAPVWYQPDEAAPVRLLRS